MPGVRLTGIVTSRPAILVVDDDPLVRAMTTRALAALDHELLEAEDGVQALALLQEEEAANVRLVITDIRMPGMNGDDLGRLLRGFRPALPVLYISGHAAPTLDFLRPGELERCWLAKPFTPRRLIAKVEGLLRGGFVAL
jgi:CheY-like chemotaxis protein